MDDDDFKDIRNQIDNNQAREYLIKNGILCKEVSGDVLIVVPKLMQYDRSMNAVILVWIKRRNCY